MITEGQLATIEGDDGHYAIDVWPHTDGDLELEVDGMERHSVYLSPAQQAELLRILTARSPHA